MNKSNFVSSLIVAALILSSCSFQEDSAASQELMMTAAAQTVEAALKTPLASPTAASTPTVVVEEGTQSATAISSAISSTPTSGEGQALASVGDVTNCRSGPGTSYERITQILPADQVPIIGFFPPNYWIVNTNLGQCWVSGEFTTPSGNFAAVPTVTAPPTPQGDKPGAPTFKDWTYVCPVLGQVDVTLSWTDKADNETGYRILRNGAVAVELPANSTSFAETTPISPGQTLAYQIQVYNLIGESTSSTANISCQ